MLRQMRQRHALHALHSLIVSHSSFSTCCSSASRPNDFYFVYIFVHHYYVFVFSWIFMFFLFRFYSRCLPINEFSTRPCFAHCLAVGRYMRREWLHRLNTQWNTNLCKKKTKKQEERKEISRSANRSLKGEKYLHIFFVYLGISYKGSLQRNVTVINEDNL